MVLCLFVFVSPHTFVEGILAAGGGGRGGGKGGGGGRGWLGLSEAPLHPSRPPAAGDVGMCLLPAPQVIKCCSCLYLPRLEE